MREPKGRPAIAIPTRSWASVPELPEAVFAAGGEPVLIEPHASAGQLEDAEVAARLDVADGVLLPGGGDLAAHWSGQEPHESLRNVDVEQDAFDLATARVALAAGTPLLAVCRGAQVVNVALGGTLVQDMDSAGGDLAHHDHRRHIVKVDEGSLLGAVVGEEVHTSCHHHQCLATLGVGLEVTARAEDGVIEAVELTAPRGWFVGVLWHPEDTWSEDPPQLAVFRALVAAARGDRAFRSLG